MGVTLLENTDLKFRKEGAIRAAKQLGYPKQCMEDIKKAKDEHSITRALINGRKGYYKKPNN